MPMNQATGQEEVGEKLYFFRSTKPGETRCLVFAHGGHLYGDGDFALPGNITLHFMQRQHGKALTTNPFQAMFLLGKPRAESLETLTASSRVTDYSLGKGVGSHWKGNTISYQEIRQKMNGQVGMGNAWTPHIVTVRRRFRGLGRLVKLSEVVPAITAHEPTVNEFFIAACRGEKLSKGVMGAIKTAFIRI
jgi:hypothetical protein